MPRFFIGFDMRAPDFGTPTPKLYSAALEMAAYADSHGVDYAVLMEHHGAPDGYLSAPEVMAAAIAARTTKMRILLGVMVLPLHDPVHVAEQIAIIDQISNGRLDVAFGIGYVPSEYKMFNVNMRERGKIMDESLSIVLRALSGERFTANGREIFVSPRPVQKPHPRIFVGGSVPASARRAARFGLGMCPAGGIVPLYREECAKLGREPGPIIVQGGWMYVTEDPDKGWRELEPHALHVAKEYSKYAEEAGWTESPFMGVDTLEKAKACGMFLVLTPDQCVELAKKGDEAGFEPGLIPLLGGLDPKLGWKSLELFVEKVLPRVRGPAA